MRSSLSRREAALLGALLVAVAGAGGHAVAEDSTPQQVVACLSNGILVLADPATQRCPAGRPRVVLATTSHPGFGRRGEAVGADARAGQGDDGEVGLSGNGDPAARDGGHGVIHACADDGRGMLRMVDPGEACAAGESAVEWSVQGPQGAPGAPGPTGAPGPAGVQGPSGAALSGAALSRLHGADQTVIAALLTVIAAVTHIIAQVQEKSLEDEATPKERAHLRRLVRDLKRQVRTLKPFVRCRTCPQP